ncbi:MAG: hypothetical protein IJZ90_04785, partial [Clostridia bacterium]|nr:hypothetical protein [Clostridia bacterium]
VINKVRNDMVRKGDMLTVSDIVDILSEDLIGVIPDDEFVIISTNRGEPVVLSSDKSIAGNAYYNIARRIMGETVPIIDTDRRKRKKREGLFRKLFGNRFDVTEEEEYV